MLRFVPYLVFFLLCILIMAPFFAPGYLFLLDMPADPSINLSDYTRLGIQSNFPILLLRVLLSFIFPSDLVMKLIFFVILFFCSSFMFKLAREFMSSRWALISGVFYMINPFVYERLLAGHWYVLLGYMFFPLVIYFYLLFLKNTKLNSFLIFSLSFSLMPILSLHWFYISFWMLLIIGGVYIFLNKPIKLSLIKVFNYFAIFSLSFLILNSFWILNSFNQGSPTLKITKDDLAVYETQSDPQFGVFFNVLSLYGFWQDDFFLPKDFNSYWYTLTIISLLISIIGAIKLVKERSLLGTTLSIIYIPVLLLAVGYGSPYTKGIIDILYDFLPGFKGLRETAKLVGVLAFSQALLLPFGGIILARFLKQITFDQISKATPFIIYFLVFSIPILETNTIFWGFDSQVKLSNYPNSWYQANEYLKSDITTNKVLFLPWWAYLNLPFSNYRNIANPSSVFFEVDIIKGSSINNPSKIETETKLSQKIYSMRDQKESLDTKNVEYFRSIGITHIILAKLQDFDKYIFLEESSLKNVFDSPEITIYKI